jgi:hypothetical protein
MYLHRWYLYHNAVSCCLWFVHWLLWTGVSCRPATNGLSVTKVVGIKQATLCKQGLRCHVPIPLGPWHPSMLASVVAPVSYDKRTAKVRRKNKITIACFRWMFGGMIAHIPLTVVTKTFSRRMKISAVKRLMVQPKEREVMVCHQENASREVTAFFTDHVELSNLSNWQFPFVRQLKRTILQCQQQNNGSNRRNLRLILQQENKTSEHRPQRTSLPKTMSGKLWMLLQQNLKWSDICTIKDTKSPVPTVWMRAFAVFRFFVDSHNEREEYYSKWYDASGGPYVNVCVLRENTRRLRSMRRWPDCSGLRIKECKTLPPFHLILRT